MADNVNITPGSGAIVATDDVSGVQFQKTKLDMGGDGASIPLVGDATYGLPCDVKRVAGNVTIVPAAAQLFPVSDNGGSLTVDGSVTAVALATAPVAVRLSTGSAFIDTIPVSGTVTVSQGTPAAAGNRWLVQLHDGTTAANVDAGTGALKVYISGGSAGGGTSLADKAAFVEGTTVMTPVGGEFIAAPTDPSDAHAAAVRITVKRAFHINLRDNSGVELGTSGNALRIDPTGGTIQPVSGTVTANLKDNAGTAYSAANPLEVQRSGRKNVRVTNSVALVASQTLVAVWTPAAGKKFYIDKIVLVVTTAGPLKLLDSTATSANTVIDSGAAVNWPTGVYVVNFDEPCASSTVDNILKYTSGAALVAQCTVHGHEA